MTRAGPVDWVSGGTVTVWCCCIAAQASIPTSNGLVGSRSMQHTEPTSHIRAIARRLGKREYMSLAELVSRLEEVESTISSLFEHHCDDERGKTALVVAPLDQTAARDVQVWLRMLQSDFLNDVLEALVRAFAEQRSLSWRHISFTSRISSRLKAVADDLQRASENWDQLYTARLEAALIPGGLNKEELLRHQAETERMKDALLQQVVASKTCLQEIETIVDRARAAQGDSEKSLIRCPITGQTCDRTLSARPNEVFVGFQFASSHYNTSSLKITITEALERFDLLPFFPDEHYEPIHISCEICHRLQQVSVCIFEISDSNPNVMFELGLAYMLGKLVILLARNDSPGTEISDIAGMHRIQYDDLIECRHFIWRCLEQSDMIGEQLNTEDDGACRRN